MKRSITDDSEAQDLDVISKQQPKRTKRMVEAVSSKVLRSQVRGMWWYRTAPGQANASVPGPQEQAVRYKEEQGHQVLAKWNPQPKQHTYGSFATQQAFVQYIQDTPERSRHFYEVLVAGEPQRMFCEMDGHFSALTAETDTEKKIVARFYELLEQVFRTLELGTLDLGVHRWLTSSRADKLSLHWVSRENRVFRNADEQKQFWQYVRLVAERDFPDLLYVHRRPTGVMEARCVIDDAVYTNNRAMRTVLSSKESDHARVLKPVGLAAARLEEYLIHAPGWQGSFYDITFPPAAEPRGLQKQANIKELIEGLIPNVRVVGTRGRLIQLRTTGSRTCIINGEINESDNAYVVWKRDGLYFGCHDAGCAGRLKKVHSWAAAQPAQAAGPPTDYHFGDAIKLAGRPHLTERDVEQYFHDCVVRVLNRGRALVFVRNRDPNGSSQWYLAGCDAPFAGPNNIRFSVPNPAYDPNKEPSKKNSPMLEKSFHDVWQRICWDQNKIGLFANVDFYPYFQAKPELNSTFNLFTGFPHASNQGTVNQEVLQVILDHLKLLCGQEDHVLDYVLRWQAHLVQYPAQKPGVALVFQSVQGAGKNMYWEFMKHVIGARYWLLVSRIDDLLGRFNTRMEGKLLTVLNEISNYGGAHRSNDYLKSIITDETLTIEPKGKEAYSIRDCGRFVFLTNNSWAVKVESRDRRYVVIECSKEQVGNRDYFRRLAGAINHPDAAPSVFQYLASLDLTGWDHRDLPHTQARDTVQLASVPAPVRYMLARLEEQQTEAYFADFSQWCKQSNERNELTARSFFQLLRAILPKRQIKSTRVWVDGQQKVVKAMSLADRETVVAALRVYLHQPDLAVNVDPVEPQDDLMDVLEDKE